MKHGQHLLILKKTRLNRFNRQIKHITTTAVIEKIWGENVSVICHVTKAK